MDTPLTAAEVQTRLREEIKKKFKKLVDEARRSRGRLSFLASQIGVKHQMLDNYAAGSMPGADVLLTAFLKWDWEIEIRNSGATPAWCKFSMTDIDKEAKKLKQKPVQLSLFDAITDLDENLETLKKSVARAEAEIERSLKQA